MSFQQLVLRIQRVAEARRYGEEKDIRRELKLLSQEAGLLASLTPLNLGGLEAPTPEPRQKRHYKLSPEHRAKIAASNKARWAEKAA